MNETYYQELEGAIAIIGMSGSFAESPNIDSYWENIKSGKECISDLTIEDLEKAGIPSELYNDPSYVKRSASLAEAKMFDPSFFGYTTAEAITMDPQHRMFLEQTWKCLEDAGYDPENYEGLIGVYAGCSQNNYILKKLIDSNKRVDSLEAFQLLLGNDKDFLSTRASYKMNLTGPSMTIQTACSTSLVAIQQACLSLLNYQCDMALSGGVSVNVPHKGGYQYKDGLIFSPDGHCRAFDAEANGTVFGDGVGVILLKRLEEAIEEKDHIYAIIRSAAINNDGSEKISYTAPSVKAQANVVATAIAIADVPADSIHYVEAHGTGTLLGDPIEAAALTEAFRMTTEKSNFCVLGSVKPNIGHLDAAAGIASVIKTVKILQEKVFPPQINFTKANPALELENSPFLINRTLCYWEKGESPRRAGVSSLGVGGTNVHLILEEYVCPNGDPVETDDSHLLLLSAKSPESLEIMKENLTKFVNTSGEKLRNIAYTLQKGRRDFTYRDFTVVSRSTIGEGDLFLKKKPFSEVGNDKKVVYLFSGQGSQYPNMGRDLYESIPFIREIMDYGFSYLNEKKGIPIKEIIFPEEERIEKSRELLKETRITQPALFLLEYAIAKYLQKFQLQPEYLLGHSLGEYTAACLAGVFTLDDALSLVADRGRIMQKAPKGAMFSVPLNVERCLTYMGDSKDLQLSVINSPGRCVISGTFEAIEKLKEHLERDKIFGTVLKTSHAYHSFMMNDILAEFEEKLIPVELHSPNMKIVSNITGEIVSEDYICSPQYWIDQLKSTVRFSQCIDFLAQTGFSLDFVEIGPGSILSTLLRLNTNVSRESLSLPTVKSHNQRVKDWDFFQQCLGQLWASGHNISWSPLSEKEGGRRVSIPTYAFRHRECWIQKETAAAKIKKDIPEATASPVIIDPKEKLRQLWSRTFSISDINDDSDFFDLGGDSLQAVRLCDELNHIFKKNISLGAIFKARTFEQQYLLISSESEDSIIPSASLITLSKGDYNNTPHLFCICGINVYQHLADAVGSPYKVSGVFLPVEQDLLINNTDLPSLEEMAEMYKEIIKGSQSNGPYYLAGLSFGGVLAYEIARQLSEEGEEIKMLAIFDSKLPQKISLFKRCCLHLRTLSLHDLRLKSIVKRRFNLVFDTLIMKFGIKKIAKTADQELIDMRALIYRRAVRNYNLKMPQYDGSAIIFRAIDSSPFEKRLYKDDLGWKEYIKGGLTYYRIPGNHLSILELNNVDKIGETLRTYLQDS